jgi:transcriptional regulator with XRE-family HTH domain
MAEEMLGPSLLWLARDNAGLTQAELGRLAGVPQSMIAAYEKGSRQATLPTLLLLLRAAGQELRLHLVPIDDQDRMSAEQEAALPAAEREAWISEQAALVARR